MTLAAIIRMASVQTIPATLAVARREEGSCDTIYKPFTAAKHVPAFVRIELKQRRAKALLFISKLKGKK
jgi:hypothetical protein